MHLPTITFQGLWNADIGIYLSGSLCVAGCLRQTVQTRQPDHQPQPHTIHVWYYYYMGVSKNRGTPKSSNLIRCSIINHPFWGTPIFGNTHMNWIVIFYGKRREIYHAWMLWEQNHQRFFFGTRHGDSGSTISTLLHDKINPKDCQVLSLGDSRFLQFFRVVSSDYGKPRDLFHPS